MTDVLKKYLEEIDHYLMAGPESEEILKEIESHILEKTRAREGDTAASHLAETIAAYGDPREVAEKYMEDSHIIAPSFRKRLFRYTWLLFVVHALLVAAVYLGGGEVRMFPPLFSVPRVDTLFGLVNRIPMVWVYDFGLVALILFFITQSGRRVRLPWPALRLKARPPEAYRPPAPRPAPLVVGGIVFAGVTAIYLVQGTFLFRSIGPGRTEPLLTGPAARVYPLVILGLFALELVFYALRFWRNTHTLRLTHNLIVLAAVWVLMNVAVPGRAAEVPGIRIPLSLAQFKTVFLLILALIVFLESVAIVYRMVRSRQKV